LWSSPASIMRPPSAQYRGCGFGSVRLRLTNVG
jgi:hypothetical protein